VSARRDEPALRLEVRLTPRGGADRIDRVEAGIIHARVAAAPADGAANDALIRLLAAELGVPRSHLRLAAGAAARRKRLLLDPGDAPRLAERWPELVA